MTRDEENLQYWLMKSEPDAYSIEDLARDKKTYWDGVRNYQARNFMRDKMKPGDLVFFYHSNAEPSGIAGIAKVTSKGYPDAENPVWVVVDIEYVKKFKKLIPLDSLRKVPGLAKMPLLQRGQRLSVQPVSAKEWEIICAHPCGLMA